MISLDGMDGTIALPIDVGADLAGIFLAIDPRLSRLIIVRNQLDEAHEISLR